MNFREALPERPCEDISRLFRYRDRRDRRLLSALAVAQAGWLSLAAFAWLLSLHPTASGRVYAAYGGVYIFVAIVWLWAVDGVRPTPWDIAGAALALAGMGVIMFAPRSA